jgi:hypothetical protein
MKKPDRGPDYRENHYPDGRKDLPPIVLREIKRAGLVKDPYRVRGTYRDVDGRERTFDALNWRAARDRARAINRELEEGRAAGTGLVKFERVWKEWRHDREEDHRRHNFPRAGTLRRDLVKSVHVLKEFSNKRISDIRSYDVERWAKKLQHEYSFGWGKACYEQVGQVVRLALRKGYLQTNHYLQILCAGIAGAAGDLAVSVPAGRSRCGADDRWPRDGGRPVARAVGRG